MMQYQLSAGRADYLQKRFLEHRLTDRGLNINAIYGLSEPIELYFLAKYYIYGNDLLIHIAKHSDCDIATAKMMFFRADIDGFLKSGENSKDFELISTILFNFQDGFYQRQYFYYDYEEDSESRAFDFDEARAQIKSFNALTKKPVRKKVVYSILDHFYHRNLKFYSGSLDCRERPRKISFFTEYFKINYKIPNGFSKVDPRVFQSFIKSWKFPETLKEIFYVTEKSLKKVVTRPVILKNDELLIIFYIFNAKPFTLKNSLKNVAVMVRDEMKYLQAFVEMPGFKEDLHKIKRFKYQDTWFAISGAMQIKTLNGNEKHLSIIFMEREELLFSLYLIADNAEDLNEDKIMDMISQFSIR